MSTRWRWSSAVDTGRRRVVSSLALLGGIVAATGSARAEDKKAEDKTLRFPGDPPENYVVYQFNKTRGRVPRPHFVLGGCAVAPIW